MSFQDISIFSCRGHFVEQSKTILKILVDGHLRSVSMKLF